MRKLGFFLGIIALLVSCNEDNEEFVKEVKHSVVVTYGDAYENLKAEGADILLVNKQTTLNYKGKTDKEGSFVFTLPVGDYRIEVSKKLSAEEALKILGIQQEAVFNASIADLHIEEKTVPTELKMISGRIGGLLIKQIYYCGSSREAANGRDQFIEIHNNSNEVLYLDGLCFAQLYGVQKPNLEGDFLLPSGQYDWTKSPDLAGADSKANTDFVYAHRVIAFPGTGKEYPLNPGKSVIAATTAQNHKAPLTIGRKTFEVEKPELTIDLSKAPFEAYFTKDARYQIDVDNPNSVDLLLKYESSMPMDMYLNYMGNEAYAIFRATDEQLNAWKKVQRPEPERRPKKHLQIPIKAIIDGVNLQNGTNPLPTHLPAGIDAGSSVSKKGKFSSESTIRKISKQIGDKTFYQDTNNSTNDFEQIDFPNTDSLK